MQFPSVSRFAGIARGAFRLSVPALLAGSLLGGCNGKDAPNGTEVENEVGVGRLYLANGSPAPYATVRIYAVDQIPLPPSLPKQGLEAKEAGAVLVTRTDAQGKYKVSDLGKGEYNILADLDDAYAYQDSLSLDAAAGPIPPDTLRDPGTVRGYVGVQPQDDPRSVTVQLLGTNRFSNVDADGAFEFQNLAGGAYSVRLETTLLDYTTTFTGLKAVAGRETDLEDTLRLIYTGIPAVRDIEVAYDTLHGVATLSWKAVRHPLLQDYVVYRDEGEDAPIFTTLRGITAKTSFVDTVYAEREVFQFSGTTQTYPADEASSHHLIWRVRARLKTQDIGPFLGSASANVPSPFLVKTASVLSRTETGYVTIGDTVKMVLDFNNPLHRVKTIRWYDEGGEPPLRTISPDSGNGTDTLAFLTGPQPKTVQIKVVLTEETGETKMDFLTFPVFDDEPQAIIFMDGGDRNFGDTLKLHGSALDKGRIVKWQWAIGPGAVFGPAGNPDTTFPADFILPRDSSLACFLKVTDEDGHSDVTRYDVQVNPWKNLVNMPSGRVGFAAVAMNGRIYAIGGNNRSSNSGSGIILNTMDAYTPGTGTWERKAAMKFERRGHGAIVYGKEILVVGGSDRNGFGVHACEFYNPETNTWREGPLLDDARSRFGLINLDGKVLAIDGMYSKDNGVYFLTLPPHSIEVYDSSSNLWAKISGRTPRLDFQTAVIGGKIYLIGGNTPLGGFPPPTPQRLFSIEVLDFPSLVSSAGPGLEYLHSASASVVYGNRVLYAGGTRDSESQQERADNLFEVLNPLDGSSRIISTIFPKRFDGSLVVMDGKAYLLGGENRITNSADLFQVFAPSLDSALATP